MSRAIDALSASREAESTTKMMPRSEGSEIYERAEEARSLPWPGVSMRLYGVAGADRAVGSFCER